MKRPTGVVTVVSMHIWIHYCIFYYHIPTMDVWGGYATPFRLTVHVWNTLRVVVLVVDGALQLYYYYYYYY